jgi:putative transposase
MLDFKHRRSPSGRGDDDATVSTRPLSPWGAGLSGEVRGESIGRGACPAKHWRFRLFCVGETQKNGRDMRFTPSIFGKLLEPIDRRQFQTIVARHHGDAYDKSFKSREHPVSLIFAQFSAASSLRGLEASWNANSQHHYHLAGGALMRSTLADANKRRPVAVFAETFASMANRLDRQTRRDGASMVRPIDSTPVPLGKLCGWAKSNGRITGMKMHIVYDPDTDYPRILDLTDANVNDAQIGRTAGIEAGATGACPRA